MCLGLQIIISCGCSLIFEGLHFCILAIDLDPRLLTACRMDIPKFCRNKKPQEGEVIPCLKNALDKRVNVFVN